MPPTSWPLRRRVIAATTAALLVGSGASALDMSLAEPARAAYPDTFNPFSMNGGFTVYAREDAVLQNQETEGSIAAGGTATVQGSSGTYSIIHVAAGTGDYTLPTVDGDPTRLLVGSYSTESTGILAITSAGTTEPALLGDLKMVERDGPWQAFARADWLRLNTDPSTPDQTPLIDATHQRYPEDAAVPVGATGGNSIYTADTSAAAVAGYVEANAEASYEAASDCLSGLPTAGGYPVSVAEDAGARVVLEPLSAGQPNLVDYADIAGAALIQFSPGPTPGVANPLIIQVPAGTSDVTGARSDPQGAYSPYILWDLSAVTGAVSVTAGEGGRIDGSVYAPTADVTVTAAPLDGQVLGRNVTIAGGEVHSYLFAGTISCSADSGSFEVRKALSGIQTADLPSDATFTVNYTATEPDGTIVEGTLELPADGSPVPAGEQFPLGTQVEFDEIAPESVHGWEWGTPTITPNPLTVGAGTAEIVVSNAATEQAGTFSVAKTIEDLSGGGGGTPSQATVPVSWTAEYDDELIAEGTLDVPFDGSAVAVGQDFPVGTRVTLTEDLTGIDPPSGYQWSDVAWNPGQSFVIDDNGAVVAVSLTNAITPSAAERTITIVKSAEGEATDPAYEYAVSYNTDPAGTRTTRALPLGDPELLDDVESDADVLQLAELLPTLDGAPVDPAAWALPVITVAADGVETTYRPSNFEGSGPLATAIVEIPLPESGNIAIDVANAVGNGTFALSKELQNVTAAQLPEGTEFTVGWTATTPSGQVDRGVMRVPADGTAVSPRVEGGDLRVFPFGTVVTFAELDAPALPWIQWQEASFEPGELEIGADGAETVTSTLTNTAALVTATFQVAKDLAGIDPDQLLVDSFEIGYAATTPAGDELAGRFDIPADGSPAGPTDDTGAPREFPLGTDVRLTEAEPDPTALPDGYEWTESTWSPSNHIVIDTGETPVLEVTNTVEELTRYAVTKVVDGDGASSLPADTTFPLDWWWTHEAQTRVDLQPNVPVLSPWFPAGSIVEVREGALPAVLGVDWGAPNWTVSGETLTPDAQGKVVLPMAVTRAGEIAELTLTNTAGKQSLPVTGGGVSAALPVAGLVLIIGGLALALMRRRPRTS